MNDFLLIANTNASTYKEFFPLLKEGKARGGYNFNKTIMFETPEGELKSGPNIAWFTSLPTPDKRKLILTKKYTPNDYPHYDNYDAIEVGRIKDIPYDYDCVMGVPITIFQYDLDNVEVLKCLNDHTPDTRVATINGKAKYCRILIKKKIEVRGIWNDKREEATMKDFLLICDKNCATYKEVFPLFKEGIVSFSSPVKEYEGTDKKFGNHSWITTFPVANKKKLVLTATYDPALYPKYDNYDAIEVSRIKNIPYDYDGVMGVPITFLDHYSPEQFEIINLGRYVEDNPNYGHRFHLSGKETYARILIRRKK